MTTTSLDAIEREECFCMRRVYRRINVEQGLSSGRVTARHPRLDRANKLARSVGEHAVPQTRLLGAVCVNMKFYTSIIRAQARLMEAYSEFKSQQRRSVVRARR